MQSSRNEKKQGKESWLSVVNLIVELPEYPEIPKNIATKMITDKIRPCNRDVDLDLPETND